MSLIEELREELGEARNRIKELRRREQVLLTSIKKIKATESPKPKYSHSDLECRTGHMVYYGEPVWEENNLYRYLIVNKNLPQISLVLRLKGKTVIFFQDGKRVNNAKNIILSHGSFPDDAWYTLH